MFCTRERNAPLGRGAAETAVRQQKAAVKVVGKVVEKMTTKGKEDIMRWKRKFPEGRGGNKMNAGGAKRRKRGRMNRKSRSRMSQMEGASECNKCAAKVWLTTQSRDSHTPPAFTVTGGVRAGRSGAGRAVGSSSNQSKCTRLTRRCKTKSSVALKKKQ